MMVSMELDSGMVLLVKIHPFGTTWGPIKHASQSTQFDSTGERD